MIYCVMGGGRGIKRFLRSLVKKDEITVIANLQSNRAILMEDQGG